MSGVPDMRKNFFDALVYKIVYALENGLIEQSTGLDGAKAVIDRVRQKVPDAQYVQCGDDCIIYKKSDAHKVAQLMEKRIKYYNSKIAECKKTTMIISKTK